MSETDNDQNNTADSAGHKSESQITDLASMLTEEVESMLQSDLEDQQLMSMGTELMTLRSMVDGLQLKIAAELDFRAACVEHTGLKTTGWFALNGNMSRTEAKHRVQTATKLKRVMPNFLDAVSHGRLSFEHAKIIAQATNPRIEDEMAQASDFFINAAENQSVDQWRRDVQAFAELVDQDGGYDPNRDIERNKLYCRDSGSSLKISGELHGELAQIAKQTLNSFADDLFRQFSQDHKKEPSIEVPPRSTLRALGLIELCRRAQAVTLKNSRASRPEVSVVIQAHDASKLYSLEGVELAKHRLPRKRPNSGPSPELLNELSKYAWFDPDDFNFNGADAVPDGESEIEHYLLCDPAIRPVVIDLLGQPLDVGREERLATDVQRAALSARDNGCIWPGCDNPHQWCDAHHVIPWQQGGETDIENLASLCRHHHVVTHLPGWEMFVHAETGEYAWTTPSGQTLHAERNHHTDIAGLAEEILQKTSRGKSEQHATEQHVAEPDEPERDDSEQPDSEAPGERIDPSDSPDAA